jgi:endoglucanase
MKLTTFMFALATTVAIARAEPVELTGVNLAGAEFGGHIAIPGEHGTHYGYPLPAEVDYFMSKGMNCFRIPFLWERLQRTPGGEFDAAEFARLDAIVRHALDRGAHVVLDVHNYARYRGQIIGAEGSPITRAHFDDFWTRLATKYRDDDRVIFGLMNEPHDMPCTEHWLETANGAIAAIRRTGARNLILVPGAHWTGAHSWTKDFYGTANGVAMLKVVDPADRFAYDVHQYLDADSSGTNEHSIVSAEIGVRRLEAFTAWCKANGRRGFLGEFAIPNGLFGDAPEEIGDEAIGAMLRHMQDNRDVWLGWSWWAAGPRWGAYPFSVEPENLGKPDQRDKPAMRVLARYATSAATTRPASN